jgi:adenylylsulfate kinase
VDPKPAKRNDVVWHPSTVTRARREALNGHRGAVLWFTGLPSSGKSTIAHLVEEHLHRAGCRTMVLDGDNVRHGLCADLGFSVDDRHENIRRIGEVAKLFVDAGVILLTAFVSPLREDRERVRGLFAPGDFLEIHTRCPADVCATRDPKGHYRRAQAGEIREFTGVSAPYEAPAAPELELDTGVMPAQDCALQVLGLLAKHSIIPGR